LVHVSSLITFLRKRSGAAHQLTPSHFERPHKFRVEWQPGPGGRLDWYVLNYKKEEKDGNVTYTEGDGNGQEWLHAYSMKDESLQKLMGSQIPIEPTYLIMNVAISSTWGFPYDIPDWCPKCYDCDDPKCACSFYPGFCQMIRSGRTAMYIDYIRVYQSSDPTAHVGANHTLGCDPPDYPTKEWIQGHEYRYMRNPPFSFEDKHPLRTVTNGGGTCHSNNDCGANITNINYTAVYEFQQQHPNRALLTDNEMLKSFKVHGRGTCQIQTKRGLFSTATTTSQMPKVCVCKDGFTGPNCLSQDYNDKYTSILSAAIVSKTKSPFSRISHYKVPHFMFVILISGILLLSYVLVATVQQNKEFRAAAKLASSSSSTVPLIGSSFISNGGQQARIIGTGIGYSSSNYNPHQHVNDTTAPIIQQG
jgi:Beta-glucan synthesis-associated protein SKN1/KRE6/Sbg1